MGRIGSLRFDNRDQWLLSLHGIPMVLSMLIRTIHQRAPPRERATPLALLQACHSVFQRAAFSPCQVVFVLH